jgi:hypothetical protein
MPQTDIGSAVASGIASTVTDYQVLTEQTDGVLGFGEFRFTIEFWPQWLGYYKNIPELQTAVDAKANWTIGSGFKADPMTTLVLDRIKGHGKDSFNTILRNMITTYTVAGDAFAEIITDEQGLLINLKPLDPSTVSIVYNEKGRIIRYEQEGKVSKAVKKYKPEQIFHLSRKRLADEIHGTSIIPAVEWIILARNEAMNDWKRVLHRNIDPLWIFHLDTDDTSKIAAFKTKMDAARGKGENMYIPKGAVLPELVSTATNASLNPLTWINQLNDYFFQTVNVPQIIVGNAKEFTDASGKIVYLSYEQSVKGEQLYIEEQALLQLNVQIKLVFPASLENDAITGKPQGQMALQNEPLQPAIEQADTTIGGLNAQ